MSNSQDIRWIQRYNNYRKALDRLDHYAEQDDLNELEEQGLIKAFEYTYELAWKTLQDLLKERGYESIVGPKQVITQSYKIGWIKDGSGWADMHSCRNLTTHVYDQAQIEEIAQKVANEFLLLFIDLSVVLENEKNQGESPLFS